MMREYQRKKRVILAMAGAALIGQLNDHDCEVLPELSLHGARPTEAELAEYELIKQKQSKLSAAKRAAIKHKVERWRKALWNYEKC